MQAVIKSGGHQYQVAVGDRLVIDRLAGETGDEVRFSQVLAQHDDDNHRWGTPYLDNVEVVGKIIRQARHAKVVVFKYKRRKNYKRTRGWKQPYTEVEITTVKTT